MRDDCGGLAEDMTLRDVFALGALEGLLAFSQPSDMSPHDFARDAYAVADAMLEERAK